MMFIRGAAVSLMLLYKGPTSLCPSSVSDLLKRKVTAQAWIAQRACHYIVKYIQHFENVF